MPIDITGQISAAVCADVLWYVSEAPFALECFAGTGYSANWWPGEENWAVVGWKKKVVGYIWMKYPLALISAEHAESIRTLLVRFDYIQIVEVADLYTPLLHFNADEIRRYVDLGYIDYGLNGGPFSAADFWFYTVT